ncbi:retrovirus-related pol polyprotein from transposon TNT 1-94 [Tanacetum coccineum]
MAESAKRHEENSNIIKEIRASIDAAIKNQGALIKTLEIQIGQMSKFLQERGFKSLPSLMETNPRDHVKSISTTKFDSTGIRYIRLAQVDLGASVSVMPFSTYTNLGLGDLAHTRLTVELADRTINHPRGIAKNVLVRIDVFKRKITLRVGEEKIVFKSIKPTTSIIRRVYMLRTKLDSKTELIGEVVNKSFDLYYGDYIELNYLDVPLEPRMSQDDNFEPTINEGIIVNEPTSRHCYKMKFSCMIGYKHVNADFFPALSINMMTKRFYSSIIKDEGDHEGKKLAGTLIDIPIFVGNFSIISGFLIIDDIDKNITSGVVLGMPFCKKFVSCQKIREKFARRDECEQRRNEAEKEKV